MTGLLLLNPPNATCEVLIGLQITGSSSAGSPPEPTASPVSSIVTGNLTFQISDLSDQGIEVTAQGRFVSSWLLSRQCGY